MSDKLLTKMTQQTIHETLQLAKIAVSFQSRDEAIKALCLAVFGAEPIYEQESDDRQWLDKKIKDALAKCD